MNPIVKNGLKIVWKVEDVDNLDKDGKFSPELDADEMKWKIKVYSHESDKIKYFALYLYAVNGNSSWLAEVSSNFKAMDKNGKLLKTTKTTVDFYTNYSLAWGWPQFLRWSKRSLRQNLKIEWVTVECEFNMKFYDFSKNPSISFDATFKVGVDEYHISKAYFCIYSKFFNEKFVKNNETTITIDDVKSDDFLKLLAALLPDPTAITWRNYDILQNLSEKFEICSLSKKCDEYFKMNQCVEIIQQIKNAEHSYYVNNLIPTLLATVKRGKEFKMLWEDKNFKKFKDSTKLALMDAAFRLL